ncbi:hypothetical protein Acr_17g0007360 [Actinidia rufa]|uniref:Uncharacterized protein n=1 Tax=Actinidia rufa TaxID=165716 RepID=A0A7J0G305_9ERIC|nr:hypothetical protein Acr_17g0007360 [Actinidia rufa]
MNGKNFNELFQNRSDKCKATIQALNNRQASKKVANLLAYDLIYCHVIPHRSDELGSVKLPTLCIEDSKEEGEEVNQLVLNMMRRVVDPVAAPKIPTAEPILVLSSYLTGSDDLAFVTLQPMGEDVIANSFKEDVPNPLAIPDPPPALQPILAITTFDKVVMSLFEAPLLDKHKGKMLVMMDDSTKYHDTSLALARVVILPNNVADPAVEGSEEILDLLIMQ